LNNWLLPKNFARWQKQNAPCHYTNHKIPVAGMWSNSYNKFFMSTGKDPSTFQPINLKSKDKSARTI